MALSSQSCIPQDIVSIFHCSFHPTQGNIIDWSLKVDEDLDLTGVEFSTLPSGLHLVDEDVVYFTKDDHQGVAVFCRRKTSEQGQRGFRLSCFGVLLAKSARPRPWKHVQCLRTLVHSMYSALEQRDVLEPADSDWDSAKLFFKERKVKRADLGGAGDWKGWNNELDGLDPDPSNPTNHLPHLLRILGLSTLTLYKHILGRRRILIYTLPPVEASCILCQVAADICYEDQVDYEWTPSDDEHPPVGMDDGSSLRLKGRCRESVKVLGMVTLNDLDMLTEAGKSERGWIACTTDAIFLDKPSYYDLVIDLTTCTSSKASRPTLYLSKPVEQVNGRGPTHRLSAVRFAWSDVKLWNELDRILHRGSCTTDTCCEPCPRSTSQSPTGWNDVWRIYEDVCIICAGLWMGTWRSNSIKSYSTVNGNMSNWGQIRLEGDDDLSLTGGGSYVRNRGMGIEGRPPMDPQGSNISVSSPRRGSKPSLLSKHGAGRDTETMVQVESMEEDSQSKDDIDHEHEHHLRERQVLKTLALLQTFHAHTAYILSCLSAFLPHLPSSSAQTQTVGLETIILTPKDLMLFELGPLSGLDAKFIEWLGDEYGSKMGVRVVVRKGWRDLVGLIFGLG